MLLVLLLIVMLSGLALAATATARINRVEVRGLRPVDGQMNVLLTGSDSREDLSRRERRRLGTGQTADGDRSDTLILLSIDGSRAAMLAFPRDLFVTRCDGSQGRINGAVGIGGPSCLVRTVTQLSGIPVTHFLQVSFGGFADIVEAVGGVPMCLDEAIADRDAHIDLPAGCQTLNGPEALGYVRVRKIDDDLGRIERQQQFLRAVAAKVAKPSTLVNPVRLFATSQAVAGALTADQGLGIVDMGRLAWALRSLAGGGLPSFTVPADGQFVGGAAVLVPDEAAAEQIFAAFRDGSALRRGDGGEESAALTPADIALEVRNGAGVAGLAADVSGVLEQAGFTVTGVGNADMRPKTVIRYSGDFEAEARYLAEHSPVAATVQRVDSGSSLVLILGRNAELP